MWLYTKIVILLSLTVVSCQESGKNFASYLGSLMGFQSMSARALFI